MTLNTGNPPELTPHQRLDKRIAEKLGWQHVELALLKSFWDDSDDVWVLQGELPDTPNAITGVPHFSTDLNAAIKLVDDSGLQWQLMSRDRDEEYLVYYGTQFVNNDYVLRYHDSACVALCYAWLIYHGETPDESI